MRNETFFLHESREDVTLTTYIHTNSNKTVRGSKRPAVLICPGGAYLACAETEQEPVALRFASMGYHAFVLKYSTYGIERKGIPNLTGKMAVEENCIFPKPMIDIAQAMLLIREHAEEWQVDTDKIILCGFSAGAHNCAMYGVYWHQPTILDAAQATPEQLKPAALILGYPITDYVMHSKMSSTMSMKNQILFRLCNVAYTGAEMPDEETLRRISPSYHVSEHTPPTFLWSTANDELVPPQHMTAMANALAENKIPFEMHVFEDGPHGLSLADQSSAEFDGQINPDVSEWVRLAERWLLRRFRLEAPRPREFDWSAIMNQQSTHTSGGALS